MGGLSNFAHDLSNNTHVLSELKQKESARKAYFKMVDHSSSSSSKAEYEEHALLLTLLLRRRRYCRLRASARKIWTRPWILRRTTQEFFQINLLLMIIIVAEVIFYRNENSHKIQINGLI